MADVIFQEGAVAAVGDKVLHFDFVVEGATFVFDERAEHKVVIILVPIVNKGKVALDRTGENKFGWVTNKGRVIV